jgi:peptidyl-prolyl cis-trans isomerase C
VKLNRTTVFVLLCALPMWALTAGGQTAATATRAALAQTGPATRAALAETAPATRPAPKLLATVGKTGITSGEIDVILGEIPQGISPEQVAAARDRLLDQLIQRALLKAYFSLEPCSDEQLASAKAKIAEELWRQSAGVTVDEFLTRRGVTDAALREQVDMERLVAKYQAAIAEAVTEEKLAAYVKASPPSYFDGTTLQASHILISVSPYAQADQAEKARRKLEEIAKDIADNKLTFAEAARKYSTCPSGPGGGTLDEFTFDKMVPAFSEAAFAMKVGQISGIVRTHFGYHLIHVTARTEGADKPTDEKKTATALAVLRAAAHAELISKATQACPVTIEKP